MHWARRQHFEQPWQAVAAVSIVQAEIMVHVFTLAALDAYQTGWLSMPIRFLVQ